MTPDSALLHRFRFARFFRMLRALGMVPTRELPLNRSPVSISMRPTASLMEPFSRRPDRSIALQTTPQPPTKPVYESNYRPTNQPVSSIQQEAGLKNGNKLVRAAVHPPHTVVGVTQHTRPQAHGHRGVDAGGGPSGSVEHRGDQRPSTGSDVHTRHCRNVRRHYGQTWTGVALAGSTRWTWLA